MQYFLLLKITLIKKLELININNYSHFFMHNYLLELKKKLVMY